MVDSPVCAVESRVVTSGLETERAERGPHPTPVTPPATVTPPASVTLHVLVTPHTPVHVPSTTYEGVMSERQSVPRTTRVERQSFQDLSTVISTSEAVKEASDEPAVVSVKHKGKAPLIDQFTGENPEIRFEDWLPSTCASKCN